MVEYTYASLITIATPTNAHYGSFESPLNEEEVPEGKVIFDESNDLPWGNNYDLMFPKPTQYHDVSYAVAFLIHLIIVFFLFAVNVEQRVSLLTYSDAELNASYLALLVLSSVCIVIAQVLLLNKFALFATYCAIIGLNIWLWTAICILMTSSGELSGIVAGLILIGVSITCSLSLYSRYAQFSASNLKVAVSAIRANLGLFALGSIIGYVLMMWISVVFVMFDSYFGSNDDTIKCDKSGDCDISGAEQFCFFLLFVSFVWTWHVILYVGQVTVAGVVGTYWTVPQEAESCCSSALVSSFVRAVTFSFGSICKGAAFHDRWALSYVGLFGLNYIDSLREAKALKNRGLEEKLEKEISLGVTIFFPFITGFLNGGLAIGLHTIGISPHSNNIDKVDLFNLFWIGFLPGFVTGAILFNFIGGAVNTTIICFIEMSEELERNHSKLSEEMRVSWLDTFLPVAVAVERTSAVGTVHEILDPL
mmetsp:Transcript_6040/g.8066  ORF Transcript_6040/g.8066 Transcript_6040/m.8066 type:complete len:478 (-) Transcript_6040:35-1468(-)